MMGTGFTGQPEWGDIPKPRKKSPTYSINKKVNAPTVDYDSSWMTLWKFTTSMKITTIINGRI
jgi:hypothetical protein